MTGNRIPKMTDYKMKQHCTDKRTGITYTLQGDYYLPNIALPQENKISVYGDNDI